MQLIHKVQQCNADHHKNNISGIQFVKEKASGTTINTATLQSKRKTFYGDLAGANNWTVYFELPELKEFLIKHFPQDIYQTKKQVDAFFISQSKKICLVGPKLTVQIEERIAFWNEKKQENMRR